jgi:hypothetical protein
MNNEGRAAVAAMEAKREQGESTNSPAVQVSLSDTLDKIQSFIHRFVVLSHAQEVVLAIWVAHTYVLHQCFTVTPYLDLTSATKSSGKTQLLEVLNYLVKDSWLTAKVSPAVLARKVHAQRPTLLLDEIDRIFKGEQHGVELLSGVLNSGYKASGSTSCCEGKNFEVKDFSTFAAKCLAGIGNALPDTVADRAIRILIKKRTKQEQDAAKIDPRQRFKKRLVQPDADRITKALADWSSTTTVTDALAAAIPTMPPGLNDRAEEVLEPLFAIAELAGDPWLTRLHRATPVLMAQASDDDVGVLLLGDIRAVFESIDTHFVASTLLLERLHKMDDKPWLTWGSPRGKNDKPMTPRSLSTLLKTFDIFPVRDVTGNARGYDRHSLEDEWSRHLSPLSPEASKASTRQMPHEDGPTKPGRPDGLTLHTPPQGVGAVIQHGCTYVFPPFGRLH